MVRERAGDGDALLHAARELVRVGARKARQPDEVDPLARVRGRLAPRLPAELEPEGHVLEHRPPRKERVALKHHAAVSTGAANLLTVEQERSGGRVVEAGEDSNERRLPATGRSDEADELAAVRPERDVLQRHDRAVIGGELATQPVHLKEDRPLVEALEPLADRWGLLAVRG